MRQATFNTPNHAAALKVTEIMYNPRDQSVAGDGGDYEFIELKNTGTTPIDLSNAYFEGIIFRFRPGTSVAPGSFVVLARNSLAFAQRYPGVTFHAIYGGGLSKGGEKIRLRNSDGTNIFSVEYDDDPPWPLSPDSFGYSLVNRNPAGNPDNPDNWRASAQINGSPGADDPLPSYAVGVVINEVLAHTDPPLEDAIELHNPTSGAIDISGWWLSDSLDNNDPTHAVLKKFRIPPSTVIPAGGYKVFYAVDFNSNPDASSSFALSEFGEAVYLSSADAGGNLTGYIVGAKFGATERGVAWGRYHTSVGVDFTPLQVQTMGVSSPSSLTNFRQGRGAANSPPAIGSVVINEIMYHPTNGGTEFVELYNRTAGAIDISGWILEGAAFTNPPATIIPAQGFLLIVGRTNITTTQFRNAHGVPASVAILQGPFDLQNGGEALDLKKPNDDPIGPPILVDRVRYNDKAPWPTEPDGAGPSLERFSAAAYGNDPVNWRSGSVGGSAGRANPSIGGPGVPPSPVTLLNARISGTQITFSFATQSNKSYIVQYSDLASSWQTATNFVGTGSTAFISHVRAPGEKRFYRVVAQ